MYISDFSLPQPFLFMHTFIQIMKLNKNLYYQNLFQNVFYHQYQHEITIVWILILIFIRKIYFSINYKFPLTFTYYLHYIQYKLNFLHC